MGSFSKKLRRNAENFEIDQFYKNMTPDQYRQAVNIAVNKVTERLSNEYNEKLTRLEHQYNESIRNTVMIAMDTLATEMIYELGNTLNCYVEEPEYLDQKIDIVQNIYDTAMKSIEDYAGHKYKTDKQAHNAFKKKKKLIKKIFKIEYGGGKNEKKK